MMRTNYWRSILFCTLFASCSNLWSMTLVLPAEGDLVGEIQYSHPEIAETLADVGLRHGIGYNEMVWANPKINPTGPLPTETNLLIPSQYILPPGPRRGLVINLAEYRLYYYPPNDNVVITMPVGIGREGWTTPLGLTKVTQKQRNPVWRPTAKLQAEAAKRGSLLPDTFPASDANPLGRHILRLGWPTYLIHGTNQHDGVGTRVSAGCIRMMPEDIEYLYELIAVGTSVRVINDPLKFGFDNGSVYIQIYPPLIKQKNINLKTRADRLLAKLGKEKINYKLLNEELINPTGLSKVVARR